MKRPAFQFYPADWKKDANLQGCSLAARGLWVEIMCIAHQCELYGTLMINGQPMNDLKISRLVGATPGEVTRLLAELEAADVFSRMPNGAVYSRRMVRDEQLRNARAEGGKEGAEHGQKGAKHGFKGGRPRKAKGPEKPPLNPPPSSSSSSSPTEEEKISTANAVDVPDGTSAARDGTPDCPHEQLVELYHELLPDCPRVAEWNDTRRGLMRSRWREKAKPNGKTQGYPSVEAGLAYWRRFFAFVGKSKFLTGQEEGHQGRPPFVANLEWLIRPTNFAKVVEGNYHR